MSDGKKQVELDVSGTGTGSVTVDGVNLANVTRRVTVDVDPNGRRGTEVMLHLKFGAVAAALADADVRVDMATSAVLIDLGWTPPGAPAMRVLTESEAKTAIFVLSWHPVDGGDPVEIPLGEGWVLPGTDVRVGEFRLSTRELPDGEASATPEAVGQLTHLALPADWRDQVGEVHSFGREDTLIELLESWQVSGG